MVERDPSVQPERGRLGRSDVQDRSCRVPKSHRRGRTEGNRMSAVGRRERTVSDEEQSPRTGDGDGCCGQRGTSAHQTEAGELVAAAPDPWGGEEEEERAEDGGDAVEVR